MSNISAFIFSSKTTDSVFTLVLSTKVKKTHENVIKEVNNKGNVQLSFCAFILTLINGCTLVNTIQ